MREMAFTIAILIAVTGTYAQYLELGGYAHGGLDAHETMFQALPGTFSCAPGFTRSKGPSWSVGLITAIPSLSFRIPYGESTWIAQARIGFENNHVVFRTLEYQPIRLDTGISTATIEHRASVWLSSITIQAGIKTSLFNPSLVIEPSFWTSFPLRGYFDQGEYLVEPRTRGRFQETGTRQRNRFSGSLLGMRPYQLGLALTIGWQEQISSRLKIRPELQVRLPLTSTLQDISWHIFSIRAGMSVVTSFVQSPPPPPPPFIHDTIPPVELVISPTPTAESLSPPLLSVEFVTPDTNGFITPIQTVQVLTQLRRYLRPILPYLFFEENSAMLPARYVELTPQETYSFNEADIASLSTLESYYHLLNVVGHRLRKYPSADLTITGCTMGVGPETNRLDLAYERARTVQMYLHTIWGIDTNRLRIVVRNLPAHPSPVGHPDGNAENARVELTSSNPAILGPLSGSITEHLVTPSKVFVRIQSQPTYLDNWQLTIKTADTIHLSLQGEGKLPSLIPLSLSWQKHLHDTINTSVIANMRAAERIYPGFAVSMLPVIERRDTLLPKRETFNLILFDFDDASIPPSQSSLLSEIARRILPATKITIAGYTDRLGDVKHNLRLAERRAHAVARALGVADRAVIHAEGSRVLLYDNTLPEGRFYSRTIEITLDQPE
ncbi:MAG: OmpA family protein [Chlorobi bacterium]|nr:OmpA family protein [Chlorobiota bacterium]